MSFLSQTNWFYTLETTPDFASWQKVSLSRQARAAC